jgi:hypothetical protein
VTNLGMTPHTSPLTGDTMVSHSSTYPTDDESRYPITPTTSSQRNDDYKLSTTERMGDALRATSYSSKNSRALHTPDILTHLICNSMDSWLARRPVLPPAWNGPEEPIQRQMIGSRMVLADAVFNWRL